MRHATCDMRHATCDMRHAMVQQIGAAECRLPKIRWSGEAPGTGRTVLGHLRAQSRGLVTSPAARVSASVVTSPPLRADRTHSHADERAWPFGNHDRTLCVTLLSQWRCHA